MIDDNQGYLKPLLLSTNLAFFGNLDFKGESTWLFLNNPQPWAQVPREWLQAGIQSLGYSPKRVTTKLLELNKYIVQDKGDLFQIFVPKNIVNQVGYLSWRQGVPFDTELLKEIFGAVNLRERGEGRVEHETINQKLAELKVNWQKKDSEAVKLVSKALDRVKENRYYLSGSLDRYKREPEKVFALNYREARLLVDNDKFLNPESGIKIHRYSFLDPEREKEYEKRLQEAIDLMIVRRQRAWQEFAK